MLFCGIFILDSENKPLPDSTTSPKGETKESGTYSSNRPSIFVIILVFHEVLNNTGAEAGFRTPPKSETAPTPRHVEGEGLLCSPKLS